ncbi:DNA cytosine methyltransferase [Anaerosinus massiliensis]|uniref:DNA cytosine methyltransferase n=1 Tax=Massilibacillus massiliensis TaxID=1806837 RepID=UPI000AAEF3BF|nr:DNA cytosine methyltransferase [Massilibacillus massiliensis]
MKILVACEESQAVTIELRKLGHEAYSCDVEPCSGGHPEWHIRKDALAIINGKSEFFTDDYIMHAIYSRWDMIIAFPPCTYLTNAGAVRLRVNGVIQENRMEKARAAKTFFMQFYNADSPLIAIENPLPGKIHGLPPYSQIIEPYMFGDPWKKRTCLWLRGLPQLKATKKVEPKGLWVGSTSSRRDAAIYSKYELSSNRNSKIRSKTFPGIAKAMAMQWAGEVIN